MLRHTPLALVLGVVAPVAALAQGAPAPDDDPSLEVLVVSDPFARWDDTRWRVDYQMLLPYPVVLYAESNAELLAVAIDARMVIACQLGDSVSRKIREVTCVVEDAAISAAPWQLNPKRGQETLDDTDRMLTGLAFNLLVSADGRITNLSLLDEPQGIRRVNVTYENLRQIVRRGLVGFHLRSDGRYTVGEEWSERNSELMTLPSFARLTIDVPLEQSVLRPDGSRTSASSGLQVNLGLEGGGETSLPTPGSGQTYDLPQLSSRIASGFYTAQAPGTYGFTSTLHRMDMYKGRYLVQSTGTGTVDVGTEAPLTYRATLDAVSVFDAEDAIMTERVWTVAMEPTAGSALADGVAGWPYRHTGSLRMLAAGEASEVGASRLVTPPQSKSNRGNLPPWPSL